MIEIARSYMDDILRRKLGEIRVLHSEEGDESFDQIRLLYFYIKHDFNFHMVATPEQIESLWHYIRSEEARLHFVMELLSEFKLRFNSDPEVKNSDGHDSALVGLIDRIAQAYGNQPEAAQGRRVEIQASHTVMDSDTAGRLPTPDAIRTLLEFNKWLVPLYLLPTIPMPEELLNGR